MAHTFFNYCDRCRRLTDILYIDDLTGEELCLFCYQELEAEYDDDEFEYDDDD